MLKIVEGKFKQFLKKEIWLEADDSDWFDWYDSDDWDYFNERTWQIGEELAKEWSIGGFCLYGDEKCLILNDRASCPDTRYSDRVILTQNGIIKVSLDYMSQI